MMPPTQRRSTSIGPTGRPPITMPAAAPLSEIVSKILRWSCNRASTISIAGTTYSVARSTSGRPTPGPISRLPRMKASSISTRGRQNEFVRYLRAVGDHHVVEQVPVVGLVDLRGSLHRLRGQADLMTDEFRAAGDLAVGDLGRDRIGVIEADVRKGLGELDRLLPLLLRGDQDIGGFLAVGIGQHEDVPVGDMSVGAVAGAPLSRLPRRNQSADITIAPNASRPE